MIGPLWNCYNTNKHRCLDISMTPRYFNDVLPYDIHRLLVYLNHHTIYRVGNSSSTFGLIKCHHSWHFFLKNGTGQVSNWFFVNALTYIPRNRSISSHVQLFFPIRLFCCYPKKKSMWDASYSWMTVFVIKIVTSIWLYCII